jgi:hypothetical protein
VQSLCAPRILAVDERAYSGQNHRTNALGLELFYDIIFVEQVFGLVLRVVHVQTVACFFRRNNI